MARRLAALEVGEGLGVEAGGSARGRNCTKAPLPQRAWDGGTWLCLSPDATSLPAERRTRARHPICLDEQ